MRRKLFTFASLLSALLCVATVVLWNRGDQRRYFIEGKVRGSRVTLNVYDGEFGFLIDRPWPLN